MPFGFGNKSFSDAWNYDGIAGYTGMPWKMSFRGCRTIRTKSTRWYRSGSWSPSNKEGTQYRSPHIQKRKEYRMISPHRSLLDLRGFRAERASLGDSCGAMNNGFGKILDIPIGFAQIFPLPTIRAIRDHDGSLANVVCAAIWRCDGHALDHSF